MTATLVDDLFSSKKGWTLYWNKIFGRNLLFEKERIPLLKISLKGFTSKICEYPWIAPNKWEEWFDFKNEQTIHSMHPSYMQKELYLT